MFIKAALVFGAFVATALAQSDASKVLFFTHVPNPITDGEPAAITYSTNDTESPVTIILRKGLASNLQTISTLTDNASGSQYVWTPSKNLPNGNDYALEIQQGKGAAQQVNYYGPFVVQGSSGAASMTASSNATMTTSMSSMSSNGTMTSHHNGTMTMTHSNATTTNTKTTKTTDTTTTPASNVPSSTSGAGFQGTQTGGQATPTGAATSDFSTGSSLALALGAVAAMLFLS